MGKRVRWPRAYLAMWVGWADSQVRRMMRLGGGVGGRDVNVGAAVVVAAVGEMCWFERRTAVVLVVLSGGSYR